MSMTDQAPLLPGDAGTLPTAVQRTPNAYVAGTALISWKCFWFCVLPAMLAGVAISLATGYWIVAVAIGGLVPLYLIWFIVTFIFFRSSFQLWCLLHPDNLFARLLRPGIENVDSFKAGIAQTALYNRERWQGNFVASGQVWLVSFKDIAEALQSPQARTFNLGEHPLIEANCVDSESGRCAFLLALSQKAATGTGDHEAFRQAVLDYCFNAEAVVRESDAVAKRLLENLAKDYKELDANTFFTDPSKGNIGFWIRYLHHVLFGLNVEDQSVLDTVNLMMAGNLQMGHYMSTSGYILPQHANIDKVAALYKTAPALRNFKVEPKYNNMTAHEFCAMMVAIIRLAGVQGCQWYLWLLTGGLQGAVTDGYLPIDTRPYWDSIDLKDERALRKYIQEVCRLSAPVTVSHHVSTKPFTCAIGGKQYTFPRGTNIAIPLCLGNVDKAQWGEDAFYFKPDRPGLEENFLGFNSVGGKHAGRECPARDLVLRSMVRVLQRMGQSRPRLPSPGPHPPVDKLPASPGFFGRF